ncbi:integrase core domain-containing protein [Nitrincola sp. MINF-07-Sa-05]|uniref:integrase core domain-containing protein n=1 Tax=Nitrincola salilacus TaxID=3400273 RepID=UPI0039182ACC
MISLNWHDAVIVIFPTLLWLVIFWCKQPLGDNTKRPIKAASGRKQKPIRTRRKPAWVADELIRLKAHLPKAGCRTLALTFNRLFADRGESVGKTFVAQTIQKHQYEIRVLQRKIRNRPAYDVPKGKYWGIDLTQVADTHQHQHTILGICEHLSRLAVSLKRLPDKASITLLRCLLEAIEQCGKPQIIRTDNEAVFTSRLFRFGLWMLSIRHQTTEKHCPWQNGRIERFFGTFKTHIKQILIEDAVQLDEQLTTFCWWYNRVRPHQNLEGRTPAEVWLGVEPPKTRHWRYVSLWQGALRGFYAPPS